MFTRNRRDFKEIKRLKVRGKENIYYVYSKSKKVGYFILILDKLNF